MHIRFVILILAVIALFGCRSPNDTGFVPRQWHAPPPVEVDAALRKTLVLLRDQKPNISRGYDLRAGRGDDYWWFDFLFLPQSPDYELMIWVYDSGEARLVPRVSSTGSTK